MAEKKFLKDLICPKCGSDNLFFEEFLQPMGCWMQLVIYCHECGHAPYAWNLNKSDQFPTDKPDLSAMRVKPNPVA